MIVGVEAASELEGRRERTDQLGFERNSEVAASFSRICFDAYLRVCDAPAFKVDDAATRRLALQRRHIAPDIIYVRTEDCNYINVMSIDRDTAIHTFQLCRGLDGITTDG